MAREGPESIEFRDPGLNVLVRAETFFYAASSGTQMIDSKKCFRFKRMFLFQNIFNSDSEAIRVMIENNNFDL